MACFVFPWVPAFAGKTGVRGGISGVTLTLALSHRGRGDVNRCALFFLGSRLRGNDGRRVKSPGRYLTRSLRVNDLGFAPPP